MAGTVVSMPAATGPAATVTVMPSGQVDATGNPMFVQSASIPTTATALWSREEMKKRFVVEDEQKFKSGHITLRRVTTKYTGTNADGTPLEVQDQIKIHTGPMYLPFLTTGKNDKGEDINPYPVSFKPDGEGGEDPAKAFIVECDAFVREWVRENNPSTPKGGKYFPMHPKDMPPDAAEMMLNDKVRSVFYTNQNNINENTGKPWEATGSARIWRNEADNIFVGEDGVTSETAVKAHAQRNTVVMTLVFGGITCGEGTINARWDISKGMVIKRSEARVTPVPSHYAQYATSAPKPANVTTDTAMGGNDPMPDTFGGIPLNESSATMPNA